MFFSSPCTTIESNSDFFLEKQQQKATLKTVEQKEAKHAKLSGPKQADLPEIADYERPELEKFDKPEFGKADKPKKVSQDDFFQFNIFFSFKGGWDEWSRETFCFCFIVISIV